MQQGSINVQLFGHGIEVSIYDGPNGQGPFKRVVLTPDQARGLAQDLEGWAYHVENKEG